MCIFFHLVEFRDYCWCCCWCCYYWWWWWWWCYGFLQFRVRSKGNAMLCRCRVNTQCMNGNKSHSYAYFPGYMGIEIVYVRCMCIVCVCTVQSTRNFNAYNQHSCVYVMRSFCWLVQIGEPNRNDGIHHEFKMRVKK